MSIDLVRVGEEWRQLALDDPLPWLFTDPRCVATESLGRLPLGPTDPGRRAVWGTSVPGR